MADAQQNKIYVQRYVRVRPEGDWQPESPLRIQSFTDWLLERKGDVWVTGAGIGRVSEGSAGGWTVETLSGNRQSFTSPS